MDNQTSIQFHIHPFSSQASDVSYIFGIFLIIYVAGIFLNAVVIAVICLDAHLHSPMYLFFCNLSSIDICYTTVIIPKLLYILISGDALVSFTQCFTQVFFFIICASAEVTLLFVMGYDRYVAICHPLSYHQILSYKICILIIVTIWITASINSLLYITQLLKLTYKEVVSIENFFCDILDIFQASSGGSYAFNILIYVNLLVYGLVPFLCNVVSYVNIVRVILRIKSKEGRRKTFSSCLSHLSVMTIYYSTGSLVYLMPFSEHTVIVKQTLSVFYIMVVPMVNPLIYSLRNSEIIKACKQMVKISGGSL